MSEVLSAGSSILGGIAENNAAKADAKIAESNASVAARTASGNVKRQHRAGLREQGTIRSKNLSGLDFLQEAVAESKLKELDITHQGAIQTEGFRNQAAQERYRGKAALIGASISASASLLKGAEKAAAAGGGGGNAQTAGDLAGGSALSTPF